MHPDSTVTSPSKTPMLLLAARQKSPHGGDFIQLRLMGYFSSGGIDFFSANGTYLTVGSAVPETDENRHPDLEACLRETLVIHRLWDRWAEQGRGLMLGLKCWTENTDAEFPTITLELVGAEGALLQVVERRIEDEATANYHPALYAILRELLEGAGKWPR